MPMASSIAASSSAPRSKSLGNSSCTLGMSDGLSPRLCNVWIAIIKRLSRAGLPVTLCCSLIGCTPIVQLDPFGFGDAEHVLKLLHLLFGQRGDSTVTIL